MKKSTVFLAIGVLAIYLLLFKEILISGNDDTEVHSLEKQRSQTKAKRAFEIFEDSVPRNLFGQISRVKTKSTPVRNKPIIASKHKKVESKKKQVFRPAIKYHGNISNNEKQYFLLGYNGKNQTLQIGDTIDNYEIKNYLMDTLYFQNLDEPSDLIPILKYKKP